MIKISKKVPHKNPSVPKKFPFHSDNKINSNLFRHLPKQTPTFLEEYTTILNITSIIFMEMTQKI
jgi:hypothetical protein